MKNLTRLLVLVLFCVSIVSLSYGEEYKYGGYKSTESIKSTAAGCAAPSGYTYLQVNNVRGRINTGGDMWWDLPGGIGAQYFIPANGSATSLFSGSLWIGGLDINQQLKLAALRYRQVGQDYWTGPLTTDGTAAVEPEVCSKYDRHYLITRAEVDEFLSWWNSDNKTEDFPNYSIPKSIMEYPAHGDPALGQSYYLAPFKDLDGDGEYNPNNGDYPYYDIDNSLCPLNFADDPNYIPARTMEEEYQGTVWGSILVDQVLKGDQTLWWIFNDKGNFHSETNGSPIGMEIRAQAFAFATNDEINNMTFYTYEIINRSTYELTNTYFCPWADTDLGYAWDDFVGCDVLRGLGYCYNGVAIDGGGEPEAYGEQPPAIGVDFFQGPYLDPDGYDNPSFKGTGFKGPSFHGDCSIVSLNGITIPMTYGEDENQVTDNFKVLSDAINGVNFGNGIRDDERYGMRRFVFHNNSGGVMGDPNIAPEYYNYLRGIWKDNSRMLYGGNAHLTSGALGPECDFMFPGDSDPCNWGTQGQPPNGGFNQNGYYWTEETVGNNPDDRRFMQSAGPFTLKPGAVNYITVGIPWARAVSGGPWASVELLRVVDDKCQALFDNCFKVIDGPSAPDLTFQELDRELIVYISNSKTSNNYKEGYLELDPQIKAITPDSLIGTPQEYDPYFRFEGYQIYQLKDATVSVSESKHDPNKCRLVAQFDIENRTGKLVNYTFDQSIGGNVPIVEVDGGNNGIVHSFRISDDMFATGDKRLVNHKQYYYSVLAYAYNTFKEYKQDDPMYSDGQKKPYLSGRKNIKLYTGIPHKTINGTIMNAEYGDGPQITRIEGQGNGGMSLELSQETINEILSKPMADPETNPYGGPNYPIAYHPKYLYGHGPVNIKVIDPLNIKKGNYTIKMDSLFYRHYTKVTGRNIIGDTVSITTAAWKLIDNETGVIYKSDTTIDINNEQLFLDLGISISLNQIFNPGPYAIGTNFEVPPVTIYEFFLDNNGVLSSIIEHSDASTIWLDGVNDEDVPASPRNWIRAGDYQDQQNPAYNDWNMPSNPLDLDENFEKIANGSWAPYVLCAYDGQSPGHTGPAFGNTATSKTLAGGLGDVSSVDIVFTPDKDKWTRCPVIEMCPDPLLAQDNTKRFAPRSSRSVDKNGQVAGVNDTLPSDDPNHPNYIAATGMGWFPGYAINLETGERLNVMFGEDSYLVGDNGRDMKMNPSERIFEFPSGNTIFGGKHFVYVMSHKSVLFNQFNLRFDFPAYDGGKALLEMLTYDTIPAIQDIYKTIAFASTMYVGLPLAIDESKWLANDTKVKIRIAKPYARYFASPTDTIPGERENRDYPMYQFTLDGLATTYNNTEKSENDLDLIRVVPNPYYAYSDYENNPLDNRVRITNLPQKCTVTIYNVNGTLIRQFTKDDPATSIDWDMKNHAGIPIAGGVYLVHIDSDAGERIIKWFGSQRIVDINRF